MGCSLNIQPSVTRNPKRDYPEIYERIKENLESGYHEEFEIRRIRYISETDVYVAYCNPVDDKEFVFEARTGGYKYGNSVWDRYGKIKIAHSIDDHYRQTVKKLFPYRKVFYTKGGTSKSWGHIPTFKEILKNNETTHIVSHIRIFEDVIKKDRERFLKSVLELKKILENQNFKKSGIYIDIYRGELFEDIDVNWLMEATDWFSNDIDLMEDGYDGYAKYSRARVYEAEKKYILRIDNEDYKKINSIKDIIKNDYMWKTDRKGYKKEIKEIKNSYRNDYLITEEEINEWKESKSR